jgi:hypothetical protein
MRTGFWYDFSQRSGERRMNSWTASQFHEYHRFIAISWRGLSSCGRFGCTWNFRIFMRSSFSRDVLVRGNLSRKASPVPPQYQ